MNKRDASATTHGPNDEDPHLMTEAEFEFLWANRPRDVE